MICDFRNGPVVLASVPVAYTFPNSYAYLAAYLKQQNEEVKLVFRDAAPRIVAQRIMSMNPVIVGFGNLFVEMNEIRDLIRELDSMGRRFPIVIGGHLVSPTPEFSVEITRADFGVIGEGEITLYNLVKALRNGSTDFSSIKGLVIRDGNDIKVTSYIGDFIEDLSLLPPVPYELFPEKEWLNIGDWYAVHYPHQILWKAGDKVINVHGGRGCPFTCNFCYHHSKSRYRPMDIMMAEAQKALDRFNGTMLYFSDDLVISSPPRAKQLVDGIAKLSRKIEYSVTARFDTLARMDDALLMEMKNTGCRIMGMGAESGSDRILQIIGKHCTADQILEGITKLKKAGIYPTVTMQFGQYTETVDDTKKTIEVVRKSTEIDPNMQWNFTITTPFPGSPLYAMLLKTGQLKNHRDFYDRYFSATRPGAGIWSQIINFSSMTHAEIMAAYNEVWNVYRSTKSRILGRPINQVC